MAWFVPTLYGRGSMVGLTTRLRFRGKLSGTPFIGPPAALLVGKLIEPAAPLVDHAIGLARVVKRVGKAGQPEQGRCDVRAGVERA
jgi:hypothetical protein